MRFRDYIKTSGLIGVTGLDREDVKTFSLNFKKCSGFTDAHDPSGGHDIECPHPEELEQDVNTVSEWSCNLRRKLKKVK